ncbi:MAG: PAS domain S-box protein [Deltaproteobacteria bacterium]|nr:PAS domain S-box protein [Deltaproteobacteria bacterium]
MKDERNSNQDRPADKKWADEFSRKLIESSPIGIYIVQGGNFKLVSPEFQRITGYSEKELLGKSSMDLVHPEDREMVRGAAIAMLKKNRLSPYEFRAIAKNGDMRWILETVTSLEYEGQEAALGYFVDITKRKEKEAAVAVIKERLAVTLGSIGDGVISTDTGGIITLMNRAAEEVTGWKEQEAIGRPLHEIFHIINEKTRKPCVNPVEQVLETGGIVGLANHTVLISRDGTEKILADSGAPIRDKDGRIIGVVLVFRDVTRQRQTERHFLEKLRESEERYRDLFENAVDAIFTVDMEGNFIEVNKAFLNDGGYKKEEVIGRHFSFMLHPDDLAIATEAYEKGRQGETFNFETRAKRKDGSFVWYSFINRPILNNNGEVVAMHGIARNIDEQKRTEKALRESEEKFRITFESAPDSVTISRIEDGRYLYVNNAFCSFTGYSKDEAIGKTPFELALYANPADREKLVSRLQENGMVDGFELQFRMKDGRVLDGLLSGRIFRYGKEDCLVAVTKDITEFKGTQEELRQSEKRYRDLFNSVSDLIYTQDLEGRFTNANRAMTSIFGYELDEFIGRKAADFMKQELMPLFYTEYIERIKKQGHCEGISGYFTKDRQKIYLEYRSNLIKPAQGEPYISGIARDVTERVLAERELKRLQKQMLQAQKMEAVGTLAGGIAHDFNNLLQAILGYTQILIMPRDESDPDIADLRQIEKAATRASELTQQLLTFSRKVESKPRPVNLNHEVQQVEKLLKRTIPKMIDIELRLEEGLATINADPAQLEQLMMNLGVNARDAMPEGGKLFIETRNVFLDESYCRDHLGARPGKYALLSISDTGIGMDKDTLEHIFDPFFTTKGVGKGTGLGLAMVYGIVKSHEGYIMCYSEPGQGTTFKIYLPVIEGETEDMRLEKREKPIPEGGHETILLVDDEDLLRGIGKDMLEKFGYTVLLAHDGESALELYSERAKDISLVILDLIMPGMGGKQCLVELLKMNPGIKVVIASGYSINGHAKDTLEAGARAFVSKPYEMNQMLGVVRKIIDEK